MAIQNGFCVVRVERSIAVSCEQIVFRSRTLAVAVAAYEQRRANWFECQPAAAQALEGQRLMARCPYHVAELRRGFSGEPINT